MTDHEDFETLRAEIEATLLTLNQGLREAMAQLRAEGMDAEVEISHARQTIRTKKVHPALRKIVVINASIRSLEIRLQKLHMRDAELQHAQKLRESTWYKLLKEQEEKPE